MGDNKNRIIMFSEKVFTFNDLLKNNRQTLMGIATICIVLFHQRWLNGMFFDVMHKCGHWGVDIFLLISGFGVCHSLSHNQLKTFYVNRLRRILPACIFMGCISLIMTLVGFKDSPRMRFLYLIPLSLHEWYISAILLFYAISPWVKKETEKHGIVFLIAVVFLCFFANAINLSYLWPLNWAIQRFPAFCFGMWVYTRNALSIRLHQMIIMMGGGNFAVYLTLFKNNNLEHSVIPLHLVYSNNAFGMLSDNNYYEGC